MTNTLRLQGIESESTDDGVRIGIMTGQLWEYSVQEYKHHGRIEGLAAQVFGFYMTTNLAEFLLNCPYDLVENGLHVDIDIGNNSAKEIDEIMEMNRKIINRERKLSDSNHQSQELRLMLANREKTVFRKVIEKLLEVRESNYGLPHEKIEQYNIILEEAELTLES